MKGKFFGYQALAAATGSLIALAIVAAIAYAIYRNEFAGKRTQVEPPEPVKPPAPKAPEQSEPPAPKQKPAIKKTRVTPSPARPAGGEAEEDTEETE